MKQCVPFQAVTRHHGDYSVMGTPSLQPFLKTYWLTPVNDWPIVAKHANMTSSRGSINAAPFFFTLLNRGYGLKCYNSRLRFAHSRAGLMAAPLQRSGEYDIS